MIAKKAASEPENLVTWVIHVGNLPAMGYRLWNAGKRCPDIRRRIVSITLRRRQDRGAACVLTAELIRLATGGHTDRPESYKCRARQSALRPAAATSVMLDCKRRLGYKQTWCSPLP